MAAIIPNALPVFLRMKRNHLLSFGSLLLLTVLSALFSRYPHLSLAIVCIAIIKCLIVAFDYMELKHAHAFWKVLLPISLFVYFIAIWVGFV